MEDIPFQTRTKATNLVGDRLSHSLHWLIARLAKLTLEKDRLICGDWNLPYAEFERAVLASVKTVLGTAKNLMVWHGGKVYQFQIRSESSWGMVTHPFWSGPLPFPVTREKRSLERDAISPWLTGIGLAAIGIGLLIPLLSR